MFELCLNQTIKQEEKKSLQSLRSSLVASKAIAFDAGGEQLTLNQWALGSSPSEDTENKTHKKVGGFLFYRISRGVK